MRRFTQAMQRRAARDQLRQSQLPQPQPQAKEAQEETKVPLVRIKRARHSGEGPSVPPPSTLPPLPPSSVLSGQSNGSGLREIPPPSSVAAPSQDMHLALKEEKTSKLDVEAQDAHHMSNRAECQRPIVPERHERRILDAEKSAGPALVFPELPPANHEIRLPGGQILKGENFSVCPGVLDTDTVEDPGVGARLIYSTILPRDRQKYFKNCLDDMDTAERLLDDTYNAERLLDDTNSDKHLLDLMDNSERLLIQGLQGMVVANARNRALLAQAHSDVAKWRDEAERWQHESQHFRGHIRNLESAVEELKAQMDIMSTKNQSLVEEHQQMRCMAEEQQQEFSETKTSYAALLQDHSRTVEELTNARAHELKLQRQVQDMDRKHKERERDITAIRSKAVREYRLSKDCFERKQAYASGFIKCGFYLARHFLEMKRPGETYPELVYTPEVTSLEVPDWRKYDLDPRDPVEYLDSTLVDNMANLFGPWSPYVREADAD